jgi:drug/metabolite transporter (DMT)-like permease
MRGNHTLLGLVLGILAVVLFGASLPATRVAVAALDPYFVTAARGTGAGAIAAAVLLILRRPVPWGDLPALLLISICLVVGFPTLMAVAMTTLPSSHGGVILGLLPIATAVAAVFVAGERPSLVFWAMSVLGAALVVAFALPEGGIVPAFGDILLFAVSRRMPGWEVISWAVVLALPVMLPLSFLLWPEDAAAVPVSSWTGLAYSALVAQYLGYFLWNSALALGGVARVSQVQLLMPFATIAVAAILLGEAVELRMIGFAAAVVVVVALGLRARVGAKAASVAIAAETGRS